MIQRVISEFLFLSYSGLGFHSAGWGISASVRYADPRCVIHDIWHYPKASDDPPKYTLSPNFHIRIQINLNKVFVKLLQNYPRPQQSWSSRETISHHIHMVASPSLFDEIVETIIEQKRKIKETPCDAETIKWLEENATQGARN